MDDDDELEDITYINEGFISIPAYRWSWYSVTAGVLGYVANEMKAHHNYRVTRRLFAEQSAREIEMLVEEQ